MMFAVFSVMLVFGQNQFNELQNMEKPEKAGEAIEKLQEPLRSPDAIPPEKVEIDRSKGLTYDGVIEVAILTPDVAAQTNFIAELNQFEFINASLFPQAQIPVMTVEDLMPYDVIITYNNNQWTDPHHVGNVLADYIDAGGAFIEGNYVMDFFGWELGGRYFNENYSPWMQAIGDGTKTLTLVIIEEEHPIFEGVELVGTGSTMFLNHPGLVDATLLADWSDGWHAIAEKDDPDKAIIGIQLLTSANNAVMYTGDGALLYANTIVYLTQPSEFTITFDIKDEEGNEIPDATVTFAGIENPPGDYVFEEIEPGTYEYKVEREGYFTVEDEITVEQETTIEVIMESALFTVTFEVVDEEGDPITDAVITLGNVVYDPGEYVIEDVPYGEYYYSVEKEGYKTYVGEIYVDEDITVPVVVGEGDPEVFAVTFKVIDVEGDAIPGATIVFDEESFTTDANGNVYIPNVEAGIYEYSVTKEEYIPVEDIIGVGENVNITVTLLTESFTVTFDVADETTGDPITDAVITFDYEAYEPGEYVFENVAPGEYPYSVAKEGYMTQFGVVEVIDEDILEEVMLTEGTDDLCIVTFIVEDADGVAVEDAVVTFDEQDYTTDGDGQVVIEDVEVGFYSYLVTKAGYMPVEDMATVDGDVTVNVTLYPETFTVTFNVVDQEGEPITDAVVTLNGMTNDPGNYVFENIEAGTYDYIVEREGYITVEGEITVEDDTTVDVTMTAELYTLELVASPEEGGDVEGAGEYKMGAEVTVEAIPADNWLFIDWTDEDGEVVSEEAEFHYTMPGEDVTLTANFEFDPPLYTLTLNADPADGGNVDGAGEYEEGTEVTIIATPEEEFVFVDWTGDTQYIDDAESATATVTMPDADITLTANFLHISVKEIHAVEINVYPNPARDEFKVESSEMIKQIRLISISGQVIMNVDVGTLNHKLNVSNLRSGVYFMEIHTAEDVVTKRVQISH